MKKVFKFVLSALLIAISINSFAQVNKYQAEVDASYGIGIGTFNMNRLCIETLHGLRVDPNVFMGVGIGYNSLTKDGLNVALIPVFANIKGYLSSKKAKPFGSIDFGYGIGTGEIKGSGGVYMSPSVGLSTDKFNVSVAYQSQSISDSGISINLEAIAFKIGIIL